MTLNERIELLDALRNYMTGNDEEWQNTKSKAFGENNWFLPEFVNLSIKNITDNYLSKGALQKLAEKYNLPQHNEQPKKVGIIMAGNIPLVGFHDLLCVFLTGNIAYIKPSSKDDALVRHLVKKLVELNESAQPYIVISEMLKGCDAYIATGSNNSSRYFDYYFAKYPHIIRRNRTAVAILKGDETDEDLDKLADDIQLYFGLGCRNVTKLYVPEGYNFVPLLNALRKWSHFIAHNKYKNNFDYNLAIHLLNKKYYMTNESVLLIEDDALTSPIAQLNYEFYKDVSEVKNKLAGDDRVQCIVSRDDVPFGMAQCPVIDVFADGTDTLSFLLSLKNN